MHWGGGRRHCPSQTLAHDGADLHRQGATLAQSLRRLQHKVVPGRSFGEDGGHLHGGNATWAERNWVASWWHGAGSPQRSMRASSAAREQAHQPACLSLVRAASRTWCRAHQHDSPKDDEAHTIFQHVSPHVSSPLLAVAVRCCTSSFPPRPPPHWLRCVFHASATLHPARAPAARLFDAIAHLTRAWQHMGALPPPRPLLLCRFAILRKASLSDGSSTTATWKTQTHSGSGAGGCRSAAWSTVHSGGRACQGSVCMPATWRHQA